MLVRSLGLVFCAGLMLATLVAPRPIVSEEDFSIWDVEALRPGMRGYGVSVFSGSKLERFEVEILGVLKNTNPGRDMVLARLAGCNLEKTGVIAGMSGSPIYVQNKLVGALAYSWAFGKEPIAGITPFRQMASLVAASSQRSDWTAARMPLPAPLEIAMERFTAVSISEGDSASPVPDEMLLQPLQSPLCTTGFSARALEGLRDTFLAHGLVPVQMGGAASYLKKKKHDHAPLKPGDPLAVALVVGDFDMSGIGTVTHVEGQRVYGWGHPFLGIGPCALPMYAAHIHAIYPRQTVSFKMGSPVRQVGTLDSDVSTGIAGVLGSAPTLIPVEATVQRGSGGQVRRYGCEVVPHRVLFPQLVLAILTNSVELEGELPEELTAELDLKVELEDLPPLVLHDVFSGSHVAGARAPIALFTPISSLLQTLLLAPYEGINVKRVTCTTKFFPYRATGEIESVRLSSDVYAPGETLRASAWLRPYRGTRSKVELSLPLPAGLPEGDYTLQVCDGPTHVRLLLRDDPLLGVPQSREKLLEQQRLLCSAERTNIVARLAVSRSSLAVDGLEHRDLPASVAEQLSESRRSTPIAQTLPTVVVASAQTPYVVQGLHKLKFTVSRQKSATP